MAVPNPWDPACASNAAGLLLNQLVTSGMVTEEMLNMSKKTAPCFENFSRLQQINNIQAEIYQKSLEIELLELEKESADVIHPFYLNTWYVCWNWL
ncbi:PREDICTED: HAUS augmin-like complex subunit 2 isoform X3 [Dipodomys ordii]|uniref:HAUS augmin-like complex subunit 2 isoform X3 n=1 Tax=Dipodomys ordii TaxID=10020 RepID=A0A1S3ENH2_DIPOR|nr:PREDICTED: HAUS augmin-like complex subunit 2 isoform X3 [Dipodomys ordii]